MELTDFGMSCLQTLLFVMEVILPVVCACVLTAIQVVDAMVCGYRFSLAVPGAGVSGALARLFFSEKFFVVLGHAVFTQIFTTIFVISFATLYRTGLFRARAKAISAGWRKRTMPSIFFFLKALPTVLCFVSVIPVAFRLLDVLGLGDPLVPFMLLGGGAVYLAGTVCIAVFSRLACAVPVLEDASDSVFAATRRSLALVGAGKFWAAAAVFALLDGVFVAMAVQTALPSQFLASVTATEVVLCTVVVVMLVAQPLVYVALSDNYHSFYSVLHSQPTSLPVYHHTTPRLPAVRRRRRQWSGAGVSCSLPS